jgi:hypothetical protein
LTAKQKFFPYLPNKPKVFFPKMKVVNYGGDLEGDSPTIHGYENACLFPVAWGNLKALLVKKSYFSM